MPPSRTPPLHPLPAQALALPWSQALRRLVGRRFVFKFLSITAVLWVFFVAYFYLLRHPVRPVTVMPLTALDHWLPFQPAAMAAYASLWLYVGIPAGLMPTPRHLVVYGSWIAALCLTGLLCFYVFPTAVPTAHLPANIASHAGFALLQGVDAAGNAFPSLHVATAVFSAVWIDRLLHQLRAPAWPRVLNALWGALIVYSTLAIRQHVALDVAGGVVLALAFALPSLRWVKGLEHGPG